MERPPFQYDAFDQFIEEELLPQNEYIQLPPFPNEVDRAVHLVFGTLDDREVLVLTETRDHGHTVGYDTHLRKRVVIVDIATNSIYHLSTTRVYRDTHEEVDKYREVYIDEGVPDEERPAESTDERKQAYELFQEIYQMVKNPPLPQRLEAVEER